MPKPVPTRFTEYEFSQAEFYTATRFSPLNLMLIQTLLSQDAQEKNNLKVDLSIPGKTREQAVDEFLQREAELQGSMRAYEHLLSLFRETEAPQSEQSEQKADIPKPAVQPATPIK